MLIPIRCFTCGKPVADKYEQFKSMTSGGKGAASVLDELGFDRYCCRRMFLAQSDLTEEIKKYPRF